MSQPSADAPRIHPLHDNIAQMVQMIYTDVPENDVPSLILQVEQLVSETATAADFLQIIFKIGARKSAPEPAQTPSAAAVASTLAAVLDTQKLVRSTATADELQHVMQLILGFLEAMLHVAPTCATLQMAALFVRRKVLNERVLIGCFAKGLCQLGPPPFSASSLMPAILDFLPVSVDTSDVATLQAALDTPKVAEVTAMWVASITQEIACVCDDTV